MKCWWHKLMCKFGKHKLYVIKNLSSDTQLIGCKHCHKKWGMNHSVKAFLLWDYELEQMYKSFGVKEN